MAIGPKLPRPSSTLPPPVSRIAANVQLPGVDRTSSRRLDNLLMGDNGDGNLAGGIAELMPFPESRRGHQQSRKILWWGLVPSKIRPPADSPGVLV